MDSNSGAGRSKTSTHTILRHITRDILVHFQRRLIREQREFGHVRDLAAVEFEGLGGVQVGRERCDADALE